MAKSLSELSTKLNKWATTETQKMQTDLYEGIKQDTPVDTGKAQAGWENKQITNLGQTGLVKNDVEYIGWLEFGSDDTAPHGMVRRNIKRVIS